MALSSTDAQLEIRAAEAFRTYLAGVAGLTGVTWVRGDEPGERELPLGVVVVTQLRQAWPGSDEFEGVLEVGYDSSSVPDATGDGRTGSDADQAANRVSHIGIAALIANALGNQTAIRNRLNAGAGNRPATDLHFYQCREHEEPGTTQDGDVWTTILRRAVTIARVDYAEDGGAEVPLTTNTGDTVTTQDGQDVTVNE